MLSRLLAVLAVALLAIAVLFPASKVDHLKTERRAALETVSLLEARRATEIDDSYVDSFSRPFPLSGGQIFRGILVVDGLLLGYGGLVLGILRRQRPKANLIDPEESPRQGWERWEMPALWTITGAALALRLAGVTQDLWLDEITTVIRYTRIPLHIVLLEASTSNNHLLNSLLCAMFVKLFGMSEPVVRLPAVLFGVASVPVLHRLVRMFSGGAEALFSAAMLALSYHHIFFSQNARGYSGFLFGALLGTYGVCCAVRERRIGGWVLAALGWTVSVLSLLMGLLVVGAQALALLLFYICGRREGKAPFPLPAALGAVGGTAWALAHAYGMVVPDVLGFVFGEYRRPNVGWQPSWALMQEFLKGIPLGGATLVALLVALLVVGSGFVSWSRRSPLPAALLAGPVVATVAVVLILRSAIFPRFFLFALPVAIIFAARGVSSLIDAAARILPERRRPIGNRVFQLGAVVMLVLGSAWMLRSYYTVPKQDYRGAMEYVRARLKPGDAVVAVGTAGEGYRYYWPSLTITNNVSQVRSLAGRGGSVWLLYAFEDDMQRRRPRLLAFIREHFDEERTFAATVPGGSIHVCHAGEELRDVVRGMRP